MNLNLSGNPLTTWIMGTTADTNTIWPWHIQQFYGPPQDYYPARDTQYAPITLPTPKKEGINMRGLFEVFIVDPERDDIVAQQYVVAANDERARLKAFRAANSALPGDIDDYDIIVRRIGDVRAKRTVAEVRVVKEGA